jgi:hypothetical protein
MVLSRSASMLGTSDIPATAGLNGPFPACSAGDEIPGGNRLFVKQKGEHSRFRPLVGD